MVMSSFVAGAEIMTFFTLPAKWALAFVPSVKWPVDSTTIWAPSEDQSISAGSFDGEDLDGLSVNADRVAVDLDIGVQRAEDRVVLQQMRQRLRVSKIVGGNELEPGLSRPARSTFLPIRPKPLIPTLIAIRGGFSFGVL